MIVTFAVPVEVDELDVVFIPHVHVVGRDDDTVETLKLRAQIAGAVTVRATCLAHRLTKET